MLPCGGSVAIYSKGDIWRFLLVRYFILMKQMSCTHGPHCIHKSLKTKFIRSSFKKQMPQRGIFITTITFSARPWVNNRVCERYTVPCYLVSDSFGLKICWSIQCSAAKHTESLAGNKSVGYQEIFPLRPRTGHRKEEILQKSSLCWEIWYQIVTTCLTSSQPIWFTLLCQLCFYAKHFIFITSLFCFICLSLV